MVWMVRTLAQDKRERERERERERAALLDSWVGVFRIAFTLLHSSLPCFLLALANFAI